MRHLAAFTGRIKDLFHLQAGDTFLDLTLGDGSHTQEALEAGARVISLDVDPESISRAVDFISPRYTPLVIRPEVQASLPPNFRWLVINSNFSRIGELKTKFNLPDFQAAIADLGTSQHQLSVPQRGFSFASTGPLDMRLDQHLSVTAADLLRGLSESELVELFLLGDEYKAKTLAREIVKQRLISPIDTTDKLVAIITKIKGEPVRGKIHPATKIFMALRMVVNLEREALSQMLQTLPGTLSRNGTIGIISFHSGEDRIVKRFFREKKAQGILRVITVKPIKPSQNDIYDNPKIRSAKLRLAQKII